MRKFEGIRLPESWDDVTLREFSDYNKLVVDYQERVEGYEALPEDELDVNQVAIDEVELNFAICGLLSGLKEEDVYALDIAFVKEYVENLTFMTKDYQAKELKSFIFKDVNYNVPNNIAINTKFGQYVEALQAEMNDRYTDKDSVIYLAHQLAHIVDNGNEWNGVFRDKLAREFEDLPASIGLDFAFFLSKKCQIYSLAYLKYEAERQVKRLPFTKRISLGLVGLKRFLSWQNLKSLISLINLRLTVFYIQIRTRYSNIYRILQRKAIMSQR